MLLKVLLILVIIFLVLFVLSWIIYFFNLDMKLASLALKPLSAWYDHAEKKRNEKEKNTASKN